MMVLDPLFWCSLATTSSGWCQVHRATQCWVWCDWRGSHFGRCVLARGWSSSVTEHTVCMYVVYVCRVFVSEQAVHTERTTWDHMENCAAVRLFQLLTTEGRVPPACVSVANTWWFGYQLYYWCAGSVHDLAAVWSWVQQGINFSPTYFTSTTKMVTKHFHLQNKRCVNCVSWTVTVPLWWWQEMFSLCIEEPWDEQLITNTVETTDEGWITMTGFLAFWT